MAPANGRMVPRTVVMEGKDNGSMDRTAVVLDDGALKVTAIEVNHKPVEPAYGYRFDYKGRSLVISGDTAFHLPLAKAAAGTDVLFHEAESQHMLQAADISNRANAKLLAIYHADPPVRNLFLEKMFTRGLAAARKGDWLISQDGTLIELPLNGNQIKLGSIAQ